MELESIPRDSNGHPILDRGTEVGTTELTSVDTDGSALTLPCDCKELLIICREGASAWKMAGTIDSATTALTIRTNVLRLPVCAEIGAEPITLYAVSGTVNFDIILFR
jgi:hypothetical protein